MTRNMGKKTAFLFLSCVILLGLASGAHRTDPVTATEEAYIEVHGPSIAFVPLSAKYVTYDGVVRKVSRFAATLLTGEQNCRCPNCCDGRCYVLVYTDLIVPVGPKRMLFILWVDC